MGDAAQPRPPRTGSVRQDADHRPAREAQPPGRDRGERHGRRETRRDVAPEQWTSIPVPGAIAEETFELAQARLRENKHYAKRNSREPALLKASSSVATAATRAGAHRRAPPSAGSTPTAASARTTAATSRVLEPADPRRRTRRARVGRSRAAPVRPTLIRAEIERRLRALRTESPATHRRDGLERELVRVKNVGEPCAGEPHARIDGGGRKPAPVGASPRGARRLSPTRPTSQFRFAWRSRIVDALVPIGHRRGTRCCYLRAAASRGATGGARSRSRLGRASHR